MLRAFHPQALFGGFFGAAAVVMLGVNVMGTPARGDGGAGPLATPWSRAAQPEQASPATSVVVHANPARTLPAPAEQAIVARARLEVERGVQYDASYHVLPSFPNGDLPPDRGACTDVVIRAFRSVDVDLQSLVYEDVAGAPSVYGHAPDWNVDHRRVTTLHAFFARHALSLSTDARDAASFRPGDVVFFAWKRCVRSFPCLPEHVGVVSDRIGPRGLPLVIQNGGPQAIESDSLDHGTLVGHFRLNQLFHSKALSPP